MNYFIASLKDFDFIEAPAPAPNVDMGAWYGFKPLYRSDWLHDLPRHKFIEAMRAENVEIGVPSAPVLATTPLYSEEADPLYADGSRRALVTAEDLPVATGVEAQALSLPTFYDWAADRPLIDQYIEAFRRVRARVDAAAR